MRQHIVKVAAIGGGLLALLLAGGAGVGHI